MKNEINLTNLANADIPDSALFERCVAIVQQRFEQPIHLSIVIVTEAAITEYNNQYRKKDKPTNVLAFPSVTPDIIDEPYLGDIICCAQVIENEAKAQDKSLEAHWAHMIIHATLHLLGFDHQEQAEAEKMETIETELLTQMGFPAPYLERL